MAFFNNLLAARGDETRGRLREWRALTVSSNRGNSTRRPILLRVIEIAACAHLLVPPDDLYLWQDDPQLAFQVHDAQGFQALPAARAVDAAAIQRLVNRAVRAADEEVAVGGEEVVVVVQRHGDVPAGVLVSNEVSAHVRREALAPDAFVGEDKLARGAGWEVSGGTEGLGAGHGAVISVQ